MKNMNIVIFGQIRQLRSGGALVLALALPLAGLACAKEVSPNNDPPGSTTAAAPGTQPKDAPKAAKADPATPAPGTPGGFGVPIAANKCPSAAPGSTTVVKELPDGMEVTVTAAGGTPINDIRQRGVLAVAASKDPALAGSEKDGLAKCPIVTKDTVVYERDVPGGAAFKLTPVKATGLDGLRADVKARATGYKPEALVKQAP